VIPDRPPPCGQIARTPLLTIHSGERYDTANFLEWDLRRNQ